MDRVRVLRVIEYEGPRDVVEETVARSVVCKVMNGMTIRGATIGTYPEVLGVVAVVAEPVVLMEETKHVDNVDAAQALCPDCNHPMACHDVDSGCLVRIKEAEYCSCLARGPAPFNYDLTTKLSYKVELPATAPAANALEDDGVSF